MKKLFLFGFLIITSACQTATPTLAPALFPTSTPPPTPIPVTAVPEPSSTPEPSPTPFPRLFTEEFDGSLAGWVILQAGNDGVPNIKTEDSRLSLQMDFPFTWLYALYGAQDYTDVRLDAQFTNRALTPSAAGLMCRYSEESGWLEYNVLTDGTYNVLYGRWLSVGIAEYLPITDGISKEVQPAGTTQTIGLTCADSTLWLYINDTLIRQVDVSRYELTEGKVGLAASSFENTPIVIGFDSVTLSEP
jgi:hypothetical protein